MDSEKALKIWDLVEEKRKLKEDHNHAEVVKNGNTITIVLENGSCIDEIFESIDLLIDDILDKKEQQIDDELEKL